MGNQMNCVPLETILEMLMRDPEFAAAYEIEKARLEAQEASLGDSHAEGAD